MNYQPLFYKQLLLGVLLAIGGIFLASVSMETLQVLGFLYVVSCCRLVYKAMASVGQKKWWWTLGAFSLIPLVGFVVPYVIVKNKLQPLGMWSGGMLKK